MYIFNIEHREKEDKEYGRRKNIHSDGMQIPGTPAPEIFLR
jgi:hypothetical protein